MLRTLIVIGLGLGITGCGGEAPPAASARVPPPPAAATGPVGAAVDGLAGPLLTHEELEAVMKTNQAQMMRLKAAIDAGDKDSALAALAIMDEGAVRAVRSKPPRNQDQMATYLAQFGAHRAALAGVRTVVESGAMVAAPPAFQALGGTCASCHKQFKPEKKED